jgi:Zn-dependent M28 family amino/carboxypeptidase
MLADQDPDPNNRNQPVPGANDGASGVAVLLELARVLPESTPKSIWLVFFDAEDNGNIPGWDWILGSDSFVSELDVQPEAAIIIDMIGDSDLNIYREQNSDQDLTDEIWAVAEDLGYPEQFINTTKHQMIDDHTPFIRAGIPAVDIIDFDYPYWHTIQDTPDKVSAQSLQAVGDTLYAWLTTTDP